MQIYECIICLLGGIGLFIAAMNMMSSNLQKVAGVGMRRLLGKITDNRFAGVGIGAIVTIIIQSSTATTVMAIGFVNAETMKLHQATAIIMGANIGTTITGILASLQSLNLSLYFSFLTFFIKNNRSWITFHINKYSTIFLPVYFFYKVLLKYKGDRESF